ncbi:1-deoxy-D-xylulose-5-phosphate reductoisomerase [Ruminococcus sp. HUN007]|uniref:1-deoxy-D-xylulose-5-phosphate reductoisomerase n=1 Tax=Ruminococcus sp. HUN007 TaxID=1514668 RepID=UPI000A552111|nr:1-deoxy-D-xylulose-5-phosphate reductoisomerase [Ruminococcus sp. HUN007]
MKRVSVLGSTGSIGLQSMDVARKHGLDIQALAANSNYAKLAEQAREFSPEMVCIFDDKYYSALKSELADTNIKVLCGMDGLCEIAADKGNDILLNSVVGMVGLLPTLTAIENGKDIALANKETLVAGGRIVMDAAAEKGVKIYPVDSEHSAIFQCLQGNSMNRISKIILTASGGPFFGKKKADLENVTVAEALNHPNWSMGNKITIDSSTLMNKGFEFIEAKWLFDLEPDQIEVVVHRQSVLHSAVQFEDFSVIGQMGVPDMRIPIQYALLYPERKECPTKPLSLTDYGTLTFEKPDLETFDCLALCIEAITKGGTYPCIVNAANEVAVSLFLNGKIRFLQIGELVRSAYEHFRFKEINNYEDVIAADTAAREYVRNSVE